MRASFASAALFSGLLLATCFPVGHVEAQPAAVDELPAGYVPSGKAMYQQYCAACHGSEGKGDGPAAFTLIDPSARSDDSQSQGHG